MKKHRTFKIFYKIGLSYFLVDHNMNKHALTYEIEKNMVDMETGQRGYVITNEVTAVVEDTASVLTRILL
ncbi:CHASE3 domain-containing protein [Paenibacillus sp. NPDC057886]|uniref:CHASE3 domain-containing protein n=1 Tax=Paenibacillus sp. NPDC057886 TaxID=3346270 RepID=UPI00369F6C23